MEPILKQPGANIPQVKKYADKFAGQVVLVTGSAGGIGSVTASMFATQGASVVLVDLNAEKLLPIAADLKSKGAQVIHKVCDLTIEDEVGSMIKDVVSTLGKIDVLVHLAGAYPFKLIVDHTSQEFSHVMRINMNSCFHLTKAVLPYMQKAGYGRIINTSSNTTIHPQPGLGVYAAAKSAIVGFTRSTAAEAGPGVTANVVCPGLIYNETTWATPGSRAVFEGAVASQLVKRYGLSTDVAEVICFIASPETEFITGQLFDISGGWTFG